MFACVRVCGLLTDKAEILHRWAEHFDSVLNRSHINKDVLTQLPQVKLNMSLDDPPCVTEVEKAIAALSNDKAPGSDAIPAEFDKAGCTQPCGTIKNSELFETIWSAEGVLQGLRDASIVFLYTRKGNQLCCDNHRSIFLVSFAGKILAQVLLSRILVHLEHGLLPENQCGFRKGRRTTDMISAARQLQKKCQEQHCNLFTAFVDLTKAFDTICRE